MSENTAFDAARLFDIRGQVAIVTGAARGNGRAIAEGLAVVGACVALADVLAEDLNDACRTITARGQKALAVVTDLRKPQDLENLVDRTVREFGRIDVLVNCAGVTYSQRSEEYPEEQWQATFDVNVNAAFRLSKLVARHMIAQRSGSIINVTSIGAEFGFPTNPAYQASKGALQQLTRALACDWAKYNIRVNNLCPGYFKTPMTQKSWSDPVIGKQRPLRWMLHRWGLPEELVGPVIFLASKASSFMTASDLVIDGGFARTGITEGQ